MSLPPSTATTASSLCNLANDILTSPHYTRELIHRHFTTTNTTTTRRRRIDYSPIHSQRQDSFSTAPSSSSDNDDDEDYPERNASIRMNPKSISRDILPGNLTYKIDLRTEERRLVHVDRAHGHFWMLKELRDTNDKPILANDSLIPAESAQLIPPLRDLTRLTGQTVHFPDCLIRDADAAKSCTLVTISYKDYGFKLLPSWIDPFTAAFLQKPSNASLLQVAVTEGGMFRNLLKPLVLRGMKGNTPTEQHDSFLTYFGDTEDWRDRLRMHNTMTGYVILVDGFGRVRWM
eukprot:CAMPEP_0172498086 /NCGR_PEP_ID=MMETSP1066-20121228/109130_1 /TAXON_ID=671091 /ORGANISM="Coscinodiscus wailesii, Strain CCMP2513" /LENGTH=289 /DNA_ID=CAMNT_0013271213 /DNA_START=131 /DNA_END=997 /DNA_ORIENTATION=-